jgi:hypothetical protein
MSDWLPSDRDALKELVDEALDSLIGFEWDPADLDDASEAVIAALESAGFVPSLVVADAGGGGG